MLLYVSVATDRHSPSPQNTGDIARPAVNIHLLAFRRYVHAFDRSNATGSLKLPPIRSSPSGADRSCSRWPQKLPNQKSPSCSMIASHTPSSLTTAKHHLPFQSLALSSPSPSPPPPPPTSSSPTPNAAPKPSSSRSSRSSIFSPAAAFDGAGGLLLCRLLRMILLVFTTTFLGSRTRRKTVTCNTRHGQQHHTTRPVSPAHDDIAAGQKRRSNNGGERAQERWRARAWKGRRGSSSSSWELRITALVAWKSEPEFKVD
jgi:type IV secretory pathway VirB10-like protein